MIYSLNDVTQLVTWIQGLRETHRVEHTSVQQDSTLLIVSVLYEEVAIDTSNHH